LKKSSTPQGVTANKRQVQNMEENGMTAGEVLNIWDELTRRGWTAEEILDFIRKVASK
jgi:hypothetical protein